MRIKLKVQGVTDISADSQLSLLIVTDEDEKRQIAIMIDACMRHEIALRRGKYVGDENNRIRVRDFLKTSLPETISAVIKYMTDIELAVVIVSVYDGEYKALLEDKNTGTSFPIRVSDGILLSYADRHIPLYIEESLWNHQSTPYMGEDAKGVSLPLNILTTDMLKAAMQKCIDEEKYEMAEQLKQELNRRKG